MMFVSDLYKVKELTQRPQATRDWLVDRQLWQFNAQLNRPTRLSSYYRSLSRCQQGAEPALCQFRDVDRLAE